MTDEDIDIVEHDLLDNPLVRKMFPDLTILKKETINFNSEVSVENIYETNIIVEQEKNDKQKIEEETNSRALSFPRSPTDKFYSRKCGGNKILEDHEITKSYMEPKSNSMDSIRKLTTFDVSKLISLVIKKNLSKTTNLCGGQTFIANDMKFHSPKLVKLLEEASGFPNYESKNLYPRKISQESDLQKEYCSKHIVSTYSINSKNFSVGNQQFNHPKKSEQTIDPERSLRLPMKCNKIILGSKRSGAMHGKKKMSILSMSENVKVSLENLSTFLRKSNRYCKICCRLFPSKKTFTDHHSLIHTQTDESQLSELGISMPLNLNNEYECSIDATVSSSPSDENTVDSVNKINVHVLQNNIQSQVEHKLNTESENIKCNHCNNGFATQQLLIDHMYNIIQNNDKNITKSFKIQDGKKGDQYNGASTRFFYRCSFCSCYFKLQNKYINHIKVKHRKNSNFKLEKVPFDPKCKLCSHIYCNVFSFNVHVRNYHLKNKRIPKNKRHLSMLTTAENATKKSTHKVTMIKKKENRIKSTLNVTRGNINKIDTLATIIDSQVGNPQSQYLLKSALFICLKCNICFLSASKAANHLNHMNILINWKCLKCSKIFKKEDELLHTQQHSFTDSFDLHEMRDIAHFVVLYKCPNCTIYFLEEDFFSHYSECETKSPLSVYCKVCHNLIDDKIKDLHEIHHKQLPDNKEMNILFVESDVITSNEQPDLPKSDTNRTEIKKIPSFAYCTTCGCFISSSNLYYHTKGYCKGVSKHVCTFCGLMLSHKSINFHRKLHKDVPGLTVHDFKFYELKSGKKICPPVPKYPNCYKCGKHFITTTEIIKHRCNEDYLQCPVCKIKLSNSAFPLHISFHNYFPRKNISGISNNQTVLDLLPKRKCHPSEVGTIDLVDSSIKEKNNQFFVYVCKNCDIALDVYDRVIEHCQDHISSQEEEIKTKPCDTCNIIFDVRCFDNHSMLHACNRDKEFVVLAFDVFYSTAELNIWLNHLFGSMPKDSVDNIIGSSIYKFERRVKMKIVQEGLKYLTFYKCAKCKRYIDSMSLFKHCQMGLHCFKSKTFQCSFCGIQFVSEDYLNEHKKIHEQQDVTISSYRIVLFNIDEDESINEALSLPNQYVLYECRNCRGIVDKIGFKNHECDYDGLSKCPHCGLLICASDYMAHVIKHIEFCSFTESNMKIILLGQVSSKLNHNLVPSFKGIRLDYLMYQCNRCLVYVKDKQSSIKHKCFIATEITKCILCELHIDASQFQNHRTFHKSNPHFIKENITVVKFGPTNPISFCEDVIVIEDDEDSENIPNNISMQNKFNKTSDIHERQSDLVIEKNDDIFECKCGLHFLNKQMALSHCETCINTNSIRQTCSKCRLDFIPSVLYNHLLAHHGTKNICYKLNIIEIS